MRQYLRAVRGDEDHVLYPPAAEPRDVYTRLHGHHHPLLEDVRAHGADVRAFVYIEPHAVPGAVAEKPAVARLPYMASGGGVHVAGFYSGLNPLDGAGVGLDYRAEYLFLLASNPSRTIGAGLVGVVTPEGRAHVHHYELPGLYPLFRGLAVRESAPRTRGYYGLEGSTPAAPPPHLDLGKEGGLFFRHPRFEDPLDLFEGELQDQNSPPYALHLRGLLYGPYLPDKVGKRPEPYGP